jgi:hypothetical protein
MKIAATQADEEELHRISDSALDDFLKEEEEKEDSTKVK